MTEDAAANPITAADLDHLGVAIIDAHLEGQRTLSLSLGLVSQLIDRARHGLAAGPAHPNPASADARLTALERRVAELALQLGSETVLERNRREITELAESERDMRNRAGLDVALTHIDDRTPLPVSSTTADMFYAVMPKGFQPRSVRLVGRLVLTTQADEGTLAALIARIAASDRLTIEDVNRLTSAGLPLWQALELHNPETPGFDTIKQSIAKGNVHFAEFLDRAEDALELAGNFPFPH